MPTSYQQDCSHIKSSSLVALAFGQDSSSLASHASQGPAAYRKQWLWAPVCWKRFSGTQDSLVCASILSVLSVPGSKTSLWLSVA